MRRMCPAEEQEAPAEPSEAASGRLASEGSSGTVVWAYICDPGTARDNNEDYAGAFAPEDPDAVSPGDVAAAVNGYRSLYEYLLVERSAP